MRLESVKASKLVIKKIELPFVPCFKEFTNPSESTMELGDEKTFIISCEMRREFAKSDIEITYDEYMQKMDNSDNVIPGKYEDTPQKRFLTTSWISGMVRENQPQNI